MIAARVRFVGLVAAAVAAAAMAGLYAQAGYLVPGGLPCLAVAATCAEGAAYVRRAAHRLQDQHRQALLLNEFEVIERWATWCCEPGFISRGDCHTANCSRG